MANRSKCDHILTNHLLRHRREKYGFWTFKLRFLRAKTLVKCMIFGVREGNQSPPKGMGAKKYRSIVETIFRGDFGSKFSRISHNIFTLLWKFTLLCRPPCLPARPIPYAEPILLCVRPYLGKWGLKKVRFMLLSRAEIPTSTL